MRAAFAVLWIGLIVLPMKADDITAVTAPENLLVLAGYAEGLSLLSNRVWSTDDLLQMTDTLPVERRHPLRRLLLGNPEPEAKSIHGFAFLTAEDAPRLAWRIGGIASLSTEADFVFTLDTARSLYEQRPILSWIDTAQVRLYTSLGEWRIGQAPLRWGGGYSGAMLLSDTAPPLPHVSYQKDWHLGRWLGTWRFQQIVAMFEEDGSQRYVMARRLSRDLSNRWHLSFSEAFKSSKLPQGAAALVTPFYLYQYATMWWYYDGKDEWFNYLADIQLQYRFGQQQVYLELLLDDLQAPRWLTRFRYRTPRKSGVLLGYHHTFPHNARITIEIAHTDGNPGGGVYSYKDPRNRWRYRDSVLGHPVGTNRDMLWIRLDTPLGRRGYLAIEHANTRLANASPEVPVGREWTVYAYYLLDDALFAGVRLQRHENRDSTDTRWLLQVGQLF